MAIEIYSYIQLHNTIPGKLAMYSKEDEQAYFVLTRKGGNQEEQIERSKHYYTRESNLGRGENE